MKDVIPTDSMWKFLAVSGVAIIVAWIALVLRQGDVVQDAILRQNDRLDALVEAGAMIQLKDGNLSAEFPGQPGSPEHHRASSLWAVHVYQRDALKKRAEDVAALAATGIVPGFGAVLVVIGFTGWYLFHQRHADAVMRSQQRRSALHLQRLRAGRLRTGA